MINREVEIEKLIEKAEKDDFKAQIKLGDIFSEVDSDI